MTSVLIAHGNTQHLRQAVEDLQRVGFTVTATPDGGDAFARFFEESPAVVVCSAGLPSLSGLNFATMVRSQSPETHVFLLADQPVAETPEGVILLADPLDVEAIHAAVPEIWPAPSHPDAPHKSVASTAAVFTLAALRRYQKGNNVLALLDDPGIQQMAAMAQHQIRHDGEIIIRQGDAGDGFYFLVEGQVRVTLKERDNAEVARINAGGFFGEMAMLSNQTRSASVSAVGDATLLWFEKNAFLPMLDQYRSLREVLSGVALQRTEENLWRVLFDDDEVHKSFEQIGTDGENEAPAETSTLSEADDLASVLEDFAAAEATAAAEPLPPSTGPALLDGSHGGLADVLEPGNTDAADIGAPTSAPTTRPTGSEAIGIDEGAESSATPSSGPETWLAHEPSRRSTSPWPPEAIDVGDEPGARRPPSAQAGQRMFILGVAAGLVAGLVGGVVGAMWVVRDALSEQAEPTEVAEPSGPSEEAADTQADAVAPAPSGPVEGASGPELELAAPDGSSGPTGPAAASGPAEMTPSGPSATAVEPAPPDAPLSEADLEAKKKLRRSLLGLVKAGKGSEAITVGAELRDRFGLDWESHFALAEAHRLAGQADAAIAAYDTFVTQYPGNLFVDDARFRWGELLAAKGDKKGARGQFEAVAADDRSEFKSEAQSKLAAP